ncbi:hypothetical protein [Streptomyces sp. 1222.5]|uniref:hypothetical protein n=1 Tax=Streptomyces sp. 1222.5 TaxID=1881026 RepID=UPI003D70C39F
MTEETFDQQWAEVYRLLDLMLQERDNLEAVRIKAGGVGNTKDSIEAHLAAAVGAPPSSDDSADALSAEKRGLWGSLRAVFEKVSYVDGPLGEALYGINDLLQPYENLKKVGRMPNVDPFAVSLLRVGGLASEPFWGNLTMAQSHLIGQGGALPSCGSAEVTYASLKPKMSIPDDNRSGPRIANLKKTIEGINGDLEQVINSTESLYKAVMLQLEELKKK